MELGVQVQVEGGVPMPRFEEFVEQAVQCGWRKEPKGRERMVDVGVQTGKSKGVLLCNARVQAFMQEEEGVDGLWQSLGLPSLKMLDGLRWVQDVKCQQTWASPCLMATQTSELCEYWFPETLLHLTFKLIEA